MSDRKEFAQRIQKEADNNFDEIQKMTENVLKLVPKRKRAKAEFLLFEMTKRMFYGNYLYECRGEIDGPQTEDPENDVMLDYDKYMSYIQRRLAFGLY